MHFSFLTGTSLTLIDALDYETTTSFQLVLEVSDRGASPLTSAARAVVNILPINERAPLMSSSNGSATISEDTPVGSLVYDANATGKHLTRSPLFYFQLKLTSSYMINLRYEKVYY